MLLKSRCNRDPFVIIIIVRLKNNYGKMYKLVLKKIDDCDVVSFTTVNKTRNEQDPT